MTHTIKVEVDGFLHHGADPADEREREVWAAMDTAWNLLRETAVRHVLEDLRTAAAAQSGRVIPSDEVIFQKMSDENAGLRMSYRDLAPAGCPPVRETFALVFAHLAEEAAEDMAEALEDL